MTEQQLSQVFARSLESTGFRFSDSTALAVARELECRSGRPDFVICPRAPLQAYKREGVAEALSAHATGHLLALLRPQAVRTRDYLEEQSGLSGDSFRKALGTLLSAELVEEPAEGRYTLSQWFRPDLEFCAFELKLRDWRRALYQALTYQAFAHRSIIVIPASAVGRMAPHFKRMRTMAVGVASLDSVTGALSLVSPVRKKRPASRAHYLYALGKFLRADAS